MEVRRLSTELYHHGKDGQKWGVMHGPPYPLDSNASVQAKKKKKSLIARYRDKRKMKAVRKAKEDKKKENEEKARIIKTGDAEQIKKISSKLSTDEMAQALTNIDFNSKLDSYISGKRKATLEKGQRFLDTTAKLANTVSSVAGAASNVHSALEKVGVIDTRSELDKKMSKLEKEWKISDYKKKIKDNEIDDTISKLDKEWKISDYKKKIKDNKSDDTFSNLKKQFDISDMTWKTSANNTKTVLLKKAIDDKDTDSIRSLLGIGKNANNDNDKDKKNKG